MAENEIGWQCGPADPDLLNHILHEMQAISNAVVDQVNGLYITSDLTVYVPDTFATIQDAFDWLANKIIVPPAIVTVALSSGAPVQEISQPLDVDLPYGNRIRLVGQPMTGLWPTDTDFTGNASNDEAMLRARFPSIIQANGCSALVMVAHQIDRIENILFLGDGTGDVNGLEFGVWAGRVGSGQAHLDHVWSHGFSKDCIRLNYASAVTGNYVGVSHAAASGIRVTNQSTCQITTNLSAFRNADYGVLVMDGGFLEFDNAVVADNSIHGVSLHIQSTARGQNVRCQNNLLGQYSVSHNSLLHLTNPTTSGTAPYSPNAGSEGNFGGWILT